jgi:hypothetical protein
MAPYAAPSAAAEAMFRNEKHGAEEACEDEGKGPAAESDEVHEQIRTPRGLDLDVRNMREREEKKRVGGEGTVAR